MLPATPDRASNKLVKLLHRFALHSMHDMTIVQLAPLQ